MIRLELRRIAAATAFLTRIPIRNTHLDNDLGPSARYFPLVGMAVGALGAAVSFTAAVALPLTVAVILGVIATVILTGAIHEDGFADSCDGFGGGATQDEVLRILKDPHIGVFGALGLGLLIALKVACLVALPIMLLVWALLCGHAVSRALCVLEIASSSYARSKDGKAAPFANDVRPIDCLVAVLIATVPVTLAPPVLWWTMPVMFAMAIVIHVFTKVRLGGYTGDTLGALQQSTEVVCYLTLVATL